MTDTQQITQTDVRRWPDTLTDAGKSYAVAERTTMQIFHFVIDTALHMDGMRVIAKRALDGESSLEKPPKEVALLYPGPSLNFLRNVRQDLLEMIFIRLVDNFTTYLSDLLRLVLVAKPEMLRSREEVKLDYVLKFSSIEELTSDLIDRKVTDLSYLGLKELVSWIEERMGFRLEKHELFDSIVEVIETRNVITHARGVIGKKYTRTVLHPKFQVGEKRVLEVDDLSNTADNLRNIVLELDCLAGDKYGIRSSQPQQDNRIV